MVNLRTYLTMCLLALSSCRVDTNATMLELQHAIAPDATCTYNVTNPVSSYGFYDPTFDPLDGGYRLDLVVRNDLEKRANDTSATDSIRILQPESLQVQLLGIEGCWGLLDPNTTVIGSYDDGVVTDCSGLPGQSGMLPISGSVDDGATQQLTTVQVLTPAHLRQIFGPSFDATKLPRIGATPATIDGAPATVFSNQTTDPAAANRAPAWGENYPSERLAPVLLQLRAVGRTQGGNVVHSGYFSFQINVCPGCAQDPCEPLVLTQCLGCPDGTACPSTGVCSSGAPCTSKPKYTGKKADTNATDVCLPAQGFGKTDCTISVACDGS